jgi:carbamoyl-phosphate synthase large subunit
VNPRVSRSSALASKATGYPIARVTSKIAIGMHLDEIQNDVTKSTPASFEPTIDYVVVKIPRWPFDKFRFADSRLTTSMKSTGETMAIGRTFEEALMKALRSLEVSEELGKIYSRKRTEELIRTPTNERLFAIYNALKMRYFDVETISEMSGIDPLFIEKIRNIVELEKKLERDPNLENLWKAKRLGLTDERISQLTGRRREDISDLRRRKKMDVTYKTVDTCSAEFEAKTPYYYSTYESSCELNPSDKRKF